MYRYKFIGVLYTCLIDQQELFISLIVIFDLLFSVNTGLMANVKKAFTGEVR